MQFIFIRGDINPASTHDRTHRVAGLFSCGPVRLCAQCAARRRMPIPAKGRDVRIVPIATSVSGNLSEKQNDKRSRRRANATFRRTKLCPIRLLPHQHFQISSPLSARSARAREFRARPPSEQRRKKKRRKDDLILRRLHWMCFWHAHASAPTTR